MKEYFITPYTRKKLPAVLLTLLLAIALPLIVLSTRERTQTESQAAGTLNATIRNDGMILLNGTPKFFFGFYQDADDGTHQRTFLLNDLNNIAAANYNLMHPAITELTDTVEYRNAAPSLGVYTITQFYQPALTSVVTAMKDSPTIFAWDLADDFNFPKESPKPVADIQNKKNQMKAIAPGHLSYGAGGGYPGYALAPYKDALDIIGIESYPVGNKDGAYLTEMAESIAYYLYAREQLPQSHAIFALPQTYAWPGERWPTPQELRNMTYGALIARMNGILYYTLYSSGGEYLPSQTALWDEAKKLGEDLSSLQTVLAEGTFISRYDTGTGSGDGTGRIHAAFWSYQGKTYVLIINTASTSKNANILLPSGVNGTLSPLFQNDTRYGTGLTIQSGSLSGSVANYAVHAYTISSSVTPTLSIPTPTSPLPTFTPIPTLTPTRTPTPFPTATIIPTSDTTKPTVSITSPQNGVTIRRRSTVTISAGASDNVGVDRVTFTVDGNSSSDYTSPYQYAWSVPGKPNTSYTIRAIAYDTSNNTAVSQISVKSNK